MEPSPISGHHSRSSSGTDGDWEPRGTGQHCTAPTGTRICSRASLVCLFVSNIYLHRGSLRLRILHNFLLQYRLSLQSTLMLNSELNGQPGSQSTHAHNARCYDCRDGDRKRQKCLVIISESSPPGFLLMHALNETVHSCCCASAFRERVDGCPGEQGNKSRRQSAQAGAYKCVCLGAWHPTPVLVAHQRGSQMHHAAGRHTETHLKL